MPVPTSIAGSVTMAPLLLGRMRSLTPCQELEYNEVAGVPGVGDDVTDEGDAVGQVRLQPWGPRSELEGGWLDEKCVCPLHPLVQLALSWRIAGGRRGEAAGGAAEAPDEGAGEPGAAVDDVINEQGVPRKEGRVDPRLHHDVAPDPLAYPLNDGVMSRDSLLELQRP